MDCRGEKTYAGAKLLHSSNERRKNALTVPTEHGEEGSSQIMVGLVEINDSLWVKRKDLEISLKLFSWVTLMIVVLLSRRKSGLKSGKQVQPKNVKF